MKKKITVYSIDVEEVKTLKEKYGFTTIYKGATPSNYDYKPKHIHYLQDKWGMKLFITGKTYKEVEGLFDE